MGSAEIITKRILDNADTKGNSMVASRYGTSVEAKFSEQTPADKTPLTRTVYLREIYQHSALGLRLPAYRLRVLLAERKAHKALRRYVSKNEISRTDHR